MRRFILDISDDKWAIVSFVDGLLIGFSLAVVITALILWVTKA